MVEVKNLSLDYGKEHILDDVSPFVAEGECVLLTGKSGSGDSDIMMTDTINPLKSEFKGFHKTFKQDDL